MRIPSKVIIWEMPKNTLSQYGVEIIP